MVESYQLSSNIAFFIDQLCCMELASPSLLSRRKQKSSSLATSIQNLSIKPNPIRRAMSI